MNDSTIVLAPQNVGFGDIFGSLLWLGVAGIYLYFAYMLYRIAYRCGWGEAAWWSYVPIMNLVLLVQMAGKPIWWFLWFLIPGINVVVYILVWMDVARNCEQSPVWGVLSALPVTNLIGVLGLAFGEKPYSYPEDRPTVNPPRQPQKVR